MGEEGGEDSLGVSLQPSLGSYIFFPAAHCSVLKVTTPGRENLQNLYYCTDGIISKGNDTVGWEIYKFLNFI